MCFVPGDDSGRSGAAAAGAAGVPEEPVNLLLAAILAFLDELGIKTGRVGGVNNYMTIALDAVDLYIYAGDVAVHNHISWSMLTWLDIRDPDFFEKLLEAVK